MAASLSEDEFQRMQEQLLELRTKNYTLGEKNLRIQSELLQNNKLLEDLRKELSKCQKVISRSKNAKEIEQLVQENDVLQQKLQMQEDEFRLQNETLMKEVSALVLSNEELEKNLNLLKAQQLTSTFTENQNDLIKLEAENSALRKLLSTEEKDDAEGSSHKFSIKELELNLETVVEEKRLLQINISKMEKEFGEQLLKIKSENEKLSEKLKKKQESFLNLQEEKEQLYNTNKLAFENLQKSKDAEVQQLREQIYGMQSNLKSALDFNDGLSKDSIATVEIDGDTATFECSLNETKMSLISIQEKMLQLSKQLQESQDKVIKSEEVNEMLNSKISELEKHNNDLLTKLTEKSELADSRKNLMDEMNNHLLETTNKHSREIENLTRQLADEQEKLQILYDKEKETKIKLVEARSEIQTLKDEVERLRTVRGDVNNKLKESVAKLENTITEYEDKLADKDKENLEALKKLQDDYQSKLQDIHIQLEVSKVKAEECEEEIKSLQQAAKDSVDDRKIQEKKGVAMVKDLKRQLQVERNRAEKLQERLQEVLNEQNRSVEEILQTSNSDKPKGDASSISSWSYVSADKEHKENLQSDTSSGGHESPNRVSPVLLESETSNLLGKIAQLQQKNWTLEEKVNHLEMSNEALVDDVLKKTALIQFYCMEGRSDPHVSAGQDKLTIKRIVDFIKDRGDENLREINRRMQRMLEETLTKNMHLQKDIETLSNEVSRLSKLVSSPVENGIQSAVFVDGV